MFPTRRAAALTSGVVALLALAGCADPDAADPDAAEPTEATSDEASTAQVVIDTFIFNPDPLTVGSGTTVTFDNQDSTTHTVTAGTRDAPRPAEFDASLADGDTAAWTVTEPGTYDYFCRIHEGPGMTGQIVVEA